MPFQTVLSSLYPVSPSGLPGRWRVLVLVAATSLVAATGTWIAGQYQIGKLDALHESYSSPVQDYAAAIFDARKHPMEQDFLEGCKQAQIGSWLQTTDALNFVDPVSGNRVQVRLDPDKSFVDINGKEIASCVQDEIESRQFDIGSMTNTWAVILLLIGLGLGGWSALIWRANTLQRNRNVYAETLAGQFAEQFAEAEIDGLAEGQSAEGENKNAPDVAARDDPDKPSS
jgi:hypothetical protein